MERSAYVAQLADRTSKKASAFIDGFAGQQGMDLGLIEVLA